MEKEKIARINELAKKSKETGLNEEEAAEQKALRAEYIAEFRASFTGILENTVIQYPDGSRQTLPEMRDAKKNDNKADDGLKGKIKSIIDAIVAGVKKVIAWFQEALGKLDAADKDFIKQLDAGKAKAGKIKDVEVICYTYRTKALRKGVDVVKQKFEKLDGIVGSVFEKFLDVDDNQFKESDIAQNEIVDNDLNVKPDFFRSLLKEMGMNEPTMDKDGDPTSPDEWFKIWEKTIRDEKKNYKLSANADYVNACEVFIRQGFQETINALKNDVKIIQDTQNNLSSKIGTANRSYNTQKETYEKMAKYLTSYGKFVTFCTRFFQHAYNMSVEARTSYKLLLQKAYDFEYIKHEGNDIRGGSK